MKGFTLVELLVVIAIIAIVSAILIPTFGRSLEAARRATCASNLKQWGVILRMYADESTGNVYPRLTDSINTDVPNKKDSDGYRRSFPHGPALYPDYWTDTELYVCPSNHNAEEQHAQFDCPTGAFCTHTEGHINYGELDPEKFGDTSTGISYHYLAYVVEDHDVFATYRFAGVAYAHPDIFGWDGYPQRLEQDIDLTEFNHRQPPVPAPTWQQHVRRKIDSEIRPFLDAGKLAEDKVPRPSGNAGTEVILRLRHGVERFLITDINDPGQSAAAQSQLSVMFDSMGGSVGSLHPERINHTPVGANVLFMDGHVTFRRYPAEHFPVDEVHMIIGRPSH